MQRHPWGSRTIAPSERVAAPLHLPVVALLSPINLATKQGGPYGIAVDDASVFWTTGGSVQKVPISGGHISTIATAQSGAASVIVDPTYVFWGNNAAGTIERAPK